MAPTVERGCACRSAAFLLYKLETVGLRSKSAGMNAESTVWGRPPLLEGPGKSPDLGRNIRALASKRLRCIKCGRGEAFVGTSGFANGQDHGDEFPERAGEICWRAMPFGPFARARFPEGEHVRPAKWKFATRLRTAQAGEAPVASNIREICPGQV